MASGRFLGVQVRKLLAAAGSLALVGLAAGCSSSATVVSQAVGGGVAHVGATLELQTQSGKGFHITLTKVVDPAQSTNNASPPKGKRFIATLFTITNTSGQTVSTDGDLDANLVGSNGNTYLPTHRALSACSSHTAKLQLAAGKSGVTCESYQVETSVHVTQVQFYPAAGSAKDYGQWLVP
jgi:hypothetical protein